MYSTNVDGGWGWVVVASAFVAQMLSDGISYGFGILYVDLMETFQGTSAEISSIGSLSYGSFCFIGPVAGALTNKLGYRSVTIIGALLEALGVFLSAYTPNLQFLYFSVGILIGVGGGMVYIASFVCVSAYFVSKRPVATSIASCGSSAGTFLFGVLYRLCIDHYGWRGALVMFSGLMLHGIVCGALFRPFAQKSPSLDLEIKLDQMSSETNHAVQQEKNGSRFIQKGEEFLNTCIRTDVYSLSQDDNTSAIECETLLPSQLAETDKGIYDAVETDNAQSAEIKTWIHFAETEADKGAFEISNISSNVTDQEKHHHEKSRIRSIISLTLGTTNLNIFREWTFTLYGISTFLFCFGYGIPFVLLPDMAEMNGFSPSEAAWVISEFGMTAVVGKFFFGALSQVFTKRDNRANTKINSVSVILAGVAITCAPWTYSYPVLLVLGGAFGLLSASADSLITVVLTELCGIERLSGSLGWTTFLGGIVFVAGPAVAAAVNTLVTLVLIELLGAGRLPDAFGWLNFLGGIGYLTGPFVAGWLFDITRAYVATFIAAGLSLTLSGIVLLPVFIKDSCRPRKTLNIKADL